MPPRPLRIRLLGGFELRRGDERIALDAPRAQSLLAHIVLHRDAPQPRQRIAFLFWPDSTEKQAQTNLRNVLHHLRRALPELDLYLAIGHHTISLRLGALVSADVVDFEDAAERGEREAGVAAVRALEEAAHGYRGDLLPGCYDEWLLPEQERLRARYLAVLERLIALQEEAGDHEKGIAVAERLLRLDPLRENVHRRLIRAHAALGDRTRALRAYHACAAVLERELGVAPSTETREVYERALGLNEAPPSSRASSGGRALVGREREWTALLDAWRATTAGRTWMVLVSGEAGIGKTRLAEELARRIAREKHPVAHARSYAAEGALAYAPVIEWLRSGALRPALAHLELPVRSDLSRLLPELGETPGVEVPAALPEAERRQRIYDAVLRAIQAVERPVALVADDLQWADRETLELLHYLVCRSATSLLIVGTVRREEIDAGHPLSDLAMGLAAADRFTEIELPRLDAAQTAALGAHATGRPLSHQEADRLYQATEGNPLFIIETLRTGWTTSNADSADAESGRASVVSPRVQAVIEARLRQLSPEGRHLAALAATIGREFTLDLLVRASGSAEASLVRSFDELWRRRIVRERGTDAYDFSHDRIREAAYLSVSPLHRRDHHLRVAQALEALRGDDPAVSGQLAWHFDRGGRPEEAVDWYVRAADAAQQLSALESVARALRRVLELLQRLPAGRERDEREMGLLLMLGAALVALKGYAAPEAGAAYRRARVLCQQLGRAVPPPMLRALALGAIATYDLDAAEAFGKELLTAGQRDRDEPVAVEGLYLLGVTAFWRGRLAASRDHLEAAIARYRPERHTQHVALYAQDPKIVCLSRLSWTLWHLGFVDRAGRARDEALSLADALGHPYSHAYALWFTLFVAIEAGDTTRVREHVAAMQRVTAEHHLLYMAAIVESFAGYAETLDGASSSGIARMEAALSDPRAAGQESVLRPQTLWMLARARAAAGRVTAAMDAVKAGLEVAARGARFWEGQFRTLEGQLLLARHRDEAAIEGAFRQALALAREQQSAWIELRAAIELAEWRRQCGTGAQRARCRHILEQAHGRIHGGSDLQTLREAERLLSALA